MPFFTCDPCDHRYLINAAATVLVVCPRCQQPVRPALRTEIVRHLRQQIGHPLGPLTDRCGFIPDPQGVFARHEGWQDCRAQGERVRMQARAARTISTGALRRAAGIVALTVQIRQRIEPTRGR